MKKLGIIGGLGPESTSMYYTEIIAAFKSKYESNGYPEIIIHSIDMKKFLDNANHGLWSENIEKMINVCEMLYKAGADLGAIASNTPHKVFDEVQARTNLKLISIVETTKQHILKKNLTKLVLLGTKFTMSSEFYPKAFDYTNVKLFTPNKTEQEYIQQKLFSEIEFGIIKPDTKAEFLKVINRIKTEEHTEGVILGCTELPLIIKPQDLDQACIDTTDLHIKAIINEIM